MHLKNILFPILIAALIAGLWGCKKLTFNDALPVVQLNPIKMLTSDSAELTGTISSQGAASVDYEGFCFGPHAVPSILENQVYGVAVGTTFKAHVHVLQDSTYYFRAFATNSYGYGTSNIVKMTIGKGNGETAPCTLADNTVYDPNPSQINDVNSGAQAAVYGKWGLEATVNSTGNVLRIEFNKVPTNGEYVSFQDDVFFGSSGPDRVYVEWMGQAMGDGGTVYVNENPDKTVTISFCNLKFYNGTTSQTLMAKVKSF